MVNQNQSGYQSQPGFQSTQQDGATHSSFSFAPGETNIFVSEYTPTLLTPWLKTELTVTSQRFLAHKANTVLGIFPLGHNDIAMPLQSISAVSLNKKFHIGRMVIALILFMIGSEMFSNGHSFGGIFFLLLMVVLLLTTVDTQLNLSNNAGSTTGIGVSILEEAKLEGFKQEVEQRLYADRALLMHQESLQQATTAAGVQQAQMSALLAQAQLQNQLNMGQQPKDQPDNQ